MTTIYDFPTVPISKQIFHVPGAATEGGYTSGFVRMLSPEPGGRSVLEIQIALQVQEWDQPTSSWLMSKGNGEVFKVRLAVTPQVLNPKSAPLDWGDGARWTDPRPYDADMYAKYASASLEGDTSVRINMSGHGNRLRIGHVIGHGNHCYIVDAVTYNNATKVATVTVKPPLRADVAPNDQTLFRPYFLGTISNMESVRTTYDAENNGAIQIGKIVFAEAVV